MNLDKVSTALASKYELFDVNGLRLLPKEIIAAYLSDKKLHRGIILNVYEKHTKVLDETGRSHLVAPEKQIIITKQVENEEIANFLLQKYEQNLKEAKDKIYTKYICAAYKNLVNNQFGLALLPVQFYNRHKFSTESWKEFVEKYTNLKDRVYYPEIYTGEFREFDKISFPDILKIFGIGDAKHIMNRVFMWYEVQDNSSVKEIELNHNDAYKFRKFKELLYWCSNIFEWNKFCIEHKLKNGQIKP